MANPQDVTLWSEDGQYPVAVLYDADEDIYRAAVDAKAEVTVNPEGIFGDELQLAVTRQYGNNETFDIISYTVPSGYTAYIRAVGGSAEKAGTVLSPFSLIKKLVDTTEVLKISWYGNNTEGTTVQRGIEVYAGETIILRITNTGGANVNYSGWINGSLVAV